METRLPLLYLVWATKKIFSADLRMTLNSCKNEILADARMKSANADEIFGFASDEIKSTHSPSRRISSNEVGFHRRRRFHPPARVDLVENDKFLSKLVVFWYGRQDLNLHGNPLEPKSNVSANSTTPAYFQLFFTAPRGYYGLSVCQFLLLRCPIKSSGLRFPSILSTAATRFVKAQATPLHFPQAENSTCALAFPLPTKQALRGPCLAPATGSAPLAPHARIGTILTRKCENVNWISGHPMSLPVTQ